jgi:hypothetical protein
MRFILAVAPHKNLHLSKLQLQILRSMKQEKPNLTSIIKTEKSSFGGDGYLYPLCGFLLQQKNLHESSSCS